MCTYEIEMVPVTAYEYRAGKLVGKVPVLNDKGEQIKYPKIKMVEADIKLIMKEQ